MSTADTITKNGLQNAADIVAAAQQVGVPVWIACGFVQQESGGANVFGNDAGGAYQHAGAVTQAKYQDFLRMVRAGHRSNGVGPLQITYPGYFKERTAEIEALWQVRPNLVFGLKLIKGSLGGKTDDASINRAGQIYNSGGPTGAPDYGRDVVAKCKRWKTLLGTASTPPAKKPAPKPVSKPATGKGALPVLRKGSKGTQVKTLQAFLQRAYPAYAGPIKKAGGADGQFGAGTAAVVKEFQRRSHLVADAIVGPATWAALRKAGLKV